MKKLLLFLALLLGLPLMAAPGASSSPLKSRTDECYELTSIVFRLAGAREYSQCAVPGYAKDIDSTFTPYKDHKVVSLAKEIRNKYGVSYDAVSSAAACLEIKNGKVVLRPGIDLSKVQKEVDPRWTPETFKTFLKYLNDFYKKSDFRDFYTKHSDLYRIAEQRLDQLLAIVDAQWFESVFGKKLDDPIVIASLTNGPSNYAFTVPDQDKKNGIAVGAGSDSKGLPVYAPGFVSIILHEILHGFTNRLSNDSWPQIDSAAQKIFPYVQGAMARNAYGNAKSTMGEWFNNVMVNVYFLQHPETQKALNAPLDRLIASDQNRGFIWMDRSMAFMRQFTDNRDKYPTIDSFMPQVVEFVKHTAGDFKQVMQELKNQKPYIVSTFPAMGSTVPVDFDTIVFRFSRPMLGDKDFGYGNIDDENVLAPYVEKRIWKDDTTLVFALKKGILQKGKTYGLWVGYAQSKKYYQMEGRLFYTFKVADGEQVLSFMQQDNPNNGKNPQFHIQVKRAEKQTTLPSKDGSLENAKSMIQLSKQKKGSPQ